MNFIISTPDQNLQHGDYAYRIKEDEVAFTKLQSHKQTIIQCSVSRDGQIYYDKRGWTLKEAEALIKFTAQIFNEDKAFNIVPSLHPPKEEFCKCLEIQGDNPDCKIHYPIRRSNE